MPILRVACYERVSTEEQALRGYSIEAQIDNLTEYCQKNHYRLVDHYTDEGISGAKPPLKRPALQRLLDDIERGEIDLVLFTKLDRWFRSVKEYFKVQEILDKHKVAWKAIHEDYDTTTANGQMAITIFLAVAQNERDRTAERIKVVLDHKRKNKEACFGGPRDPFGYTKERDDTGHQRLVKDPETRDAAQEFWDMLVATHNLNKVIRYMSNVYGIHKISAAWAKIAKNSFYCGVYDGIENFCEPYVSIENFQRLQETKMVKATPTGTTYLFRGLLRCPTCGRTLCGESKTQKSGTISKLYRCRDRATLCGNGTCIYERKLEIELLARLNEFLRDEIASVELEQKQIRSKPKNDIKTLKERRRRLTVAYMAGNLSDEQYLRDDAELKRLLDIAIAEAPPEPRNIAPLKQLLELNFTEMYDSFDEDERQRFWREMIKEIRLDGKKIREVVFV